MTSLWRAQPPLAPAGGARATFRAHLPWLALLFPALLFLLLLFIVPVGQVLWLSLKDSGGQLTGGNYAKLVLAPVYLQSLWITFKLSFWTTVVCVVGGYPVAYLLATAGPSSRQKLLILVLIPFWTSYLVRSFSWMVLLGRQGVINSMLTGLGLTDQPLSMIYNYAGALIGMVNALMPLFILAAAPVMARIDRNYLNAATTMGAGTSQSFWRIYFPLSLPGVGAGGILVFITSLGFFITPSLLGGRQETVITRIIIREVLEGLNWGFAGALSVLLLACTLTFYYLYDRVVGLSSLSGEIRKGSERSSVLTRRVVAGLAGIGDVVERGLRRLLPPRADRPQGRWASVAVWVFAVALLSFLIMPILFLIPVSFTRQSFLGWPPELFSLQWYSNFFHSPIWLPATLRSVAIGLGAATLATVLGTLASLAMAHSKMRARGFWLAVLISPMMVPRVIFSVGLFYLFAPLGLVGSSFGVALAHTVLALPYVVVTVMAVLKDYDVRLNQVAWTMGASKWEAFRRIELPLIRAGVIAAFLFAFVTSFDDLTVALFVTAGMTSTLPKEMWDAATIQVNPELAAVSTVTVGVILVVILAAGWLHNRGVTDKG